MNAFSLKKKKEKHTPKTIRNIISLSFHQKKQQKGAIQPAKKETHSKHCISSKVLKVILIKSSCLHKKFNEKSRKRRRWREKSIQQKFKLKDLFYHGLCKCVRVNISCFHLMRQKWGLQSFSLLTFSINIYRNYWLLNIKVTLNSNLSLLSTLFTFS